MGRANQVGRFASLLREHIDASLYSYGQVAQLSGVPKRTIVNWLDGTVSRPRQWQSVVRVAAALRLSRPQADELLEAANFGSLHSLSVQSDDPDDHLLLAHWHTVKVPPAITIQFLQRYLQELLAELVRLPAYFPRQTAFAFAEIYQESHLRRIEDVSAIISPAEPTERLYPSGGELWSTLRKNHPRIVILGQPGMGKTWLLRLEAMRLAHQSLLGDLTVEPTSIPLLIRLPDLVTQLAGQSGISAILRAITQLAARRTPSLPENELSQALLEFVQRAPERVVFLLDALDEVPARNGLRNLARRVVVQLGAAMPSRIILASRTLGYDAAPLGRYLGVDVAEFELLPFSEREITRLIRAWFHDRPALLERLELAMRRAPALVRQASNPLLLSLMCMVNETRDPALTGNRSGLYEPVLRLLLEGHWRSFEMQLPEGRVRAKLRLLEAIAWCYATYGQAWWEQLPGDVIEQEIEHLPDARRLWSTWHEEWGAHYEGPLWELSEWDGILIKGYLPPDGAASAVPYAFLHRTFQEFLVARYLLRRYTDQGLDAPEVQTFLTTKASDPQWYIVLLLLIEQLTVRPLSDVQPLLNRLSDILLDRVQDRTGHMAVAATEMFLNLHLSDVGAEALRSLCERLLATIRNESVNPMMRIHSARLVAELGDPRKPVMEIDAIEFVAVPAGTFLMGSDPAVDAESRREEMPQHQNATRAFAISRFPISNAQYRVFLEDEEGYENPAYWPEAIALGHWQDGMVWRMRPLYRADGTVEFEPAWAHEPYLSGWPTDLPNNPVMGISWYEARAFVRWLEERWRHRGMLPPSICLDLPSEAEWEKAARGTDGRIYPWGDEFDGTRLNWFGHMLMSPSPIGVFPNSASHYGAEEMVGNLWEWTRSVFEPYGSNYGDGTDFATVLMQDIYLAIRGGAYFSERARCRCAARSATLPFGRINATFRIVKVGGEE